MGVLFLFFTRYSYLQSPHGTVWISVWTLVFLFTCWRILALDIALANSLHTRCQGWVCAAWRDANRVPFVGEQDGFQLLVTVPSLLPFNFLRAFFQEDAWKTGVPSWSYNLETWDMTPESKGRELWGREGSMTLLSLERLRPGLEGRESTALVTQAGWRTAVLQLKWLARNSLWDHI